MMTRRESVLGGLLTVFWSHEGCCAHDSALPSSGGCFLSEGDATALVAQTAGQQQLLTTGNEPLVMSSGIRAFDFALAQTLYRIGVLFGVAPAFAFCTGGNASATNVSRMAKADGTVLFGLDFLHSLLASREHPDAAVTAVCAHEFGHILQYRLGLTSTLRGGQGTVKRQELHADFLAGYFAGTRKLQKPDYPAAVFALTQRRAGDSNFSDVQHHGTPEERGAAVVRGFETAFRERRLLSEAVEIGLNYTSVM